MLFSSELKYITTTDVGIGYCFGAGGYSLLHLVETDKQNIVSKVNKVGLSLNEGKTKYMVSVREITLESGHADKDIMTSYSSCNLKSNPEVG